jgi:pyruvate formate lyase activating enzyme
LQRNMELCTDCGYCTTEVGCPSPQHCVGCESCYLACPHEAILPTRIEPLGLVTITVDGSSFEVPGNVTVKKALESLGTVFDRYPNPKSLFAPCETGGCYACAVLVDGELQPSCHTAVKPGQTIQTLVSDDLRPLRVVGWCQPHSVGGVGTPWSSKASGRASGAYVEAACFAAGCNLRCRTCQNFTVTYTSSASAVTPEHAASVLLKLATRVGVKRLAISGGEATLNRPWLEAFFTWLRTYSQSDMRLHLDTNATVLTSDYIDALVEAGVTDVGPDLKSARLETFQTITGIKDSTLAKEYLTTAWNAVRHLADEYYPEKVFMGVGLPFNPAFYSSTEAMQAELHEWGTCVVDIDDRIQVTVLDYRPEFRRRDIERPSTGEMLDMKALLEGLGLRTVLAQTAFGHLAPSRPAPDRAS